MFLNTYNFKFLNTCYVICIVDFCLNRILSIYVIKITGYLLRPLYGTEIQMIFVNVLSISEKNVYFAITRCSTHLWLSSQFLCCLSFFSPLLCLLEISLCDCEDAHYISCLSCFLYFRHVSVQILNVFLVNWIF